MVNNLSHVDIKRGSYSHFFILIEINLRRLMDIFVEIFKVFVVLELYLFSEFCQM